MKKTVRMGALIAVAAALIVGCGDDSGSATGTSTSRATTSTPVQPAPGTETEAPAAEQPGPTAGNPGPTAGNPGPTAGNPGPTAGNPGPTAGNPGPRPGNDISGPDRCIDPASTGVQNALAGFGGGWVAVQASPDQPGNCGQLLWVRAVGGNSAGAPIHIMFFHEGTYLGTATSEPYAFTHVAGANGNAVTVEYKWLVGDEPFAAPQGGPATITYTWTGSGVAMSDPLPPEVTQPHR
ncbi:LppP/LprE family lipoprotein [Nocardia mangyaensis]|uniref:LppP/LprE family lipoprotein n=1 Tax=Nocardia mangyaensis TaxID=2213200 RepID=UPI002675BBCB|nr:LppP/LprE family lipoprotein [Nocardia mangyaensis]MDO3645730.1 LppP/LprE family lipoprotein [Nocardia mangyaensis]